MGYLETSKQVVLASLAFSWCGLGLCLIKNEDFCRYSEKVKRCTKEQAPDNMRISENDNLKRKSYLCSLQ